MGMSNSYQLFCFMFAVIKVLFLTSAIYQFATCKYECPPSSGKFLKWFNYQLITNKSPQQSPRFSCLPPSCWRCSQRWWSLGSSRYAQLRIITSKPPSNWTFDSFPPSETSPAGPHLQGVQPRWKVDDHFLHDCFELFHGRACPAVRPEALHERNGTGVRVAVPRREWVLDSVDCA